MICLGLSSKHSQHRPPLHWAVCERLPHMIGISGSHFCICLYLMCIRFHGVTPHSLHVLQTQPTPLFPPPVGVIVRLGLPMAGRPLVCLEYTGHPLPPVLLSPLACVKTCLFCLEHVLPKTQAFKKFCKIFTFLTCDLRKELASFSWVIN